MIDVVLFGGVNSMGASKSSFVEKCLPSGLVIPMLGGDRLKKGQGREIAG